MSGFFIEPSVHWYSRPWGKALVVVGILVVLPVLFVIGSTVRYWWQLRHGVPVRLVQLEGAWNNKISSVGGVPAATEAVDRSKLESRGQFFGGSLSAPVTIVEYVDFKCPNCLLVWPIIEQLKAKHAQSVKVVVRNFPIESIHPGASELAVVAECAGAQGRYAAMAGLLFSRFSTLSVPLSDTDIHLLAMDAVVDETKLKECMANPASLAAVQDDLASGVGFGVGGTPTFFVNGVRVEGVVPLEAWEKYLSGGGY